MSDRRAATGGDRPLPGGRPLAPRRDSRATRQLLVDGVGTFAREHGRPPARLAEVAAHVGVSTATAYRHFASLDDLANVRLARLPRDAIRRFDRRRSPSGEPAEELHRWNECWVAACVAHGDTAVPLRSTAGFLRRRSDGDPLVTLVCEQVEPLLVACGLPRDLGVATWNAVSDPREVVDLRETLGLSPRRIARHITDLTLATGGRTETRS